MNVPEHLAHLRRDRRGLPVPYINLWGDHDQVDRLELRFDRIVRQVAVYYRDAPDGVPDFTHQSMQRQRECMAAGLCQVCAARIPWPDRLLVVSPQTIEQIPDPTTGAPIMSVTEPWLCPTCCDYATRVCPALIGRTRDEQLVVVPVPGPEFCRLVVSSGWIEGPYERSTRRNPAAMWCKVLLPEQMLTLVGEQIAVRVP